VGLGLGLGSLGLGLGLGLVYRQRGGGGAGEECADDGLGEGVGVLVSSRVSKQVGTTQEHGSKNTAGTLLH
jgi:hypothetical protein